MTAAELLRDVALDDSVKPHGVPADEMTNVLLTGATGYLGAFLLRELCESTAADVYCLVRAESETHARSRLRSCLESYDLWDDRFSTQITPVNGDVTKPLLGLSPAAFDALAERCDTVFHSAATVNFVFPYRALRTANVSGTREVLRLSCARRAMRVHFVSTIGIFLSPELRGGTVREEEPLDVYHELANGYSQSKWVAERLMRLAGQRGIPVTIYRPGFVGWHARTGVGNDKDFVTSMLSTCALLARAPRVAMTLDVTPVDYVARAIAYLARAPSSLGRTYHLNNPRPWSWTDLVEMCRAQNVAMQWAPYEEWRNAVERLGDVASGRLATMLPERIDDQGSIFRALAQPPTFEFGAVRRDLAGSGIESPPLEPRLLRAYLTYQASQQFGRQAS
jgi:thioester reductase-like protein